MRTSVITPVGNDSYTIAPSGTTGAIVTAPATNVDTNLREVLWDPMSPDLVDSYSCATWASAGTTSAQQGLALRVTADATGTRAILITKNVFLGGVWVFNIDVWDTGGAGLTVLANVDLRSTFAANDVVVPLPWHVCGRVAGNAVDFKAWPDAVAEPAWGDARFGGSAELPPGWSSPGKAGWYVGHVPPGQSVTYADMRSGRV